MQTDSELRRQIEQATNKFRDYLCRFLEEDNDDFTGMHTTSGIPEDGFYSQDLERDLLKILTASNQLAALEARIDELYRNYGKHNIGAYSDDHYAKRRLIALQEDRDALKKELEEN